MTNGRQRCWFDLAGSCGGRFAMRPYPLRGIESSVRRYPGEEMGPAIPGDPCGEMTGMAGGWLPGGSGLAVVSQRSDADRIDGL